MPLIRCLFALLLVAFAALVVINLPYPYLSPRWFFTAAGVAFIAAAFMGFILPDNKRGDRS